MGIRQKRTAETNRLLLRLDERIAERGIEFATLDDIARTAGFTKARSTAIPLKGAAFCSPLFEQYAAVAGPVPGPAPGGLVHPSHPASSRHGMRDPLLRRRFGRCAGGKAPDGGTPDGQLLRALGRAAAGANLPHPERRRPLARGSWSNLPWLLLLLLAPYWLGPILWLAHPEGCARPVFEPFNSRAASVPRR